MGGSGRVAEEEEVPRGKTEIDLVIPIVFYNAFFENSFVVLRMLRM